MYCTSCGVMLSEDAQFCSTCGGSTITPSSRVPPRLRDWNLHVTVLGWLVFVHAGMTVLFGLAVIVLGQIAASFVRVNPELFDNDIPPEVAQLLAPVSLLIGILLLLMSMPSFAAGVGLIRYRSWGRVLTLVLSFLRLLEFPLGTLTAFYSFWVLLSADGKRFFSEKAAQAEV